MIGATRTCFGGGRRGSRATLSELSILHRENLLLLLLAQLVHSRDELVRRLLDRLVAPTLLILRGLLVLGERLQTVVGIAPDVPDGHPRLFRQLADGLGELLSALLGERGHREADDLAVVAGR